jgi:hypothetical protein
MGTQETAETEEMTGTAEIMEMTEMAGTQEIMEIPETTAVTGTMTNISELPTILFHFPETWWNVRKKI